MLAYVTVPRATSFRVARHAIFTVTPDTPISSAAPSTVPAAEVALLRRARRQPDGGALYPPPSAFQREYERDLRRMPQAAERAEIAHGIYVHLPFCYTACVFCRCNKIVTRDGGKASRYLGFLEREVVLRARALEERRVARMHWGGGTPTYHSIAQLRRLWQTVSQYFDLAPDGDYAIDIDPRTVDAGTIAALRELGFTAAVIGIPDLLPEVLDAIQRPQTAVQSVAAVRAALSAGYATVTAEVMCGLPRQTVASFIDTLGQLVHAGPHRIVIHDYVHDPRRWTIQRQIRQHELPHAWARLDMAGRALERLAAAGYQVAAPGCYVRADDRWAQARASGILVRDALGYTDRASGSIVPLGASAVGGSTWVYVQNEPELGAYYDHVAADVLPVARGYVLKPDDLLRREVINRLAAHGRVPFGAIEALFPIVFERYFEDELRALLPYAEAGLVRIAGRTLILERRGLLWAGSIARLFDACRPA